MGTTKSWTSPSCRTKNAPRLASFRRLAATQPLGAAADNAIMMKALVSALLLASTIAAAQPAPLLHKHKHGAIVATDPLPDVLSAVANETMIFEINRKDLASSGMKPDAGKRALADAQICTAAVAAALASQPPETWSRSARRRSRSAMPRPGSARHSRRS
jgi:hypothetical protein